MKKSFSKIVSSLAFAFTYGSFAHALGGGAVVGDGMPSGPIKLPSDAQVQFRCGPFMNNGQALAGPQSTVIYFSHLVFESQPPVKDIFVYLSYDGNTADVDPMDPNQAPPLKSADGLITTYYAGNLPTFAVGDSTNMSLTSDANGNPVSAQLTAVSLAFPAGGGFIKTTLAISTCVRASQ